MPQKVGEFKISANGLIRVGRRIHGALIAFKAANPVILPKTHPATVLIVRYYHQILGHAGREYVAISHAPAFLDP